MLIRNNYVTFLQECKATIAAGLRTKFYFSTLSKRAPPLARGLFHCQPPLSPFVSSCGEFMANLKPSGALFYATTGGAGFPEANRTSGFSVSDIMNEVPLASVCTTNSCTDAAAIMAQMNVGILPVRDFVTNFLVGVITDRDLLLRVVANSLDPDMTKIGEVMSGPMVVLVYEDADLVSAQRLMIEHGIRRLLVIRRRDNEVVGIVSVDDFALAGFRRRAGEILRAAAPAAAPLRSTPLPLPLGAPSGGPMSPSDVVPSFYRVSDIMTGLVECAFNTDTCREAAVKMKERSVGCLPVSTRDPRILCGMITDRDIVIRVLARRLKPNATLVQDAMTGNLISCYEDENLARAEQLMLEYSIRRLPVLRRSTGELVGMLTVDDVALAASRSRAGRVLENAALFPNVDEQGRFEGTISHAPMRATPEAALAATGPSDRSPMVS